MLPCAAASGCSSALWFRPCAASVFRPCAATSANFWPCAATTVFPCFPLFCCCFSLFPPLSHALSNLPPWIVCRYVFSVNWSRVQLHLRCNGVSTLCVPMLHICRVLQNLLPTLRTELIVHPFKISPQNPQKIELAMLKQCLFAIGRQRVPQFLSNASNHLCHYIFDITLSVCYSI